MANSISVALVTLGLLLGGAGASEAQLLLPNGQQQFTDANGLPLAGGSVYFYAPATTTAKQTWQDYGLTVPNTNPVLLNSAGRATIWGSGEYREIVYDVAGNLIWDQNTFAPTALNPSGGFGAQQQIGSSATVDLGTITSHNAQITGTATVSSFGSSAVTSAPFYLVQFAASLQLTNSASLQLPGATNIKTAAGASAFALYLGSGNWQVLAYNGAGASSAAFGQQVSLASSTTTDLGTAASNNVLVTGTNTITSLGSSALTTNPVFLVTFQSSLVLTQNATALILPGGQSITTQANDNALVLYLGGGNWQVLEYHRGNGQALSTFGSEGTIASAATTDLGTGTSNALAVSGTTTITSFGSSASTANPFYLLRFTGALTLTYNATSLVLPGKANITTAVGDTAIVQYMGGGNWIVRSYTQVAPPPQTFYPLIASGNVTTGGASVSITVPTGVNDALATGKYQFVELRIYDLQVSTTGVNLSLTFLDGGTPVVTTTYNWNRIQAYGNSSGAAGANADTSVGVGATLGTTYPSALTLRLYGTNNGSGYFPQLQFVTTGWNSASGVAETLIGGASATAAYTNFNGIQLTASTGTINSYNYRIFGVN